MEDSPTAGVLRSITECRLKLAAKIFYDPTNIMWNLVHLVGAYRRTIAELNESSSVPDIIVEKVVKNARPMPDVIHEAKHKLISLIWNKPEDELWQLIDLVNRHQEESIRQNLWSLPEKVKKVYKWQVSEMRPLEGELCWDVNRSTGMVMRDGKWEDVSYDYWVSHHSTSKLERSE